MNNNSGGSKFFDGFLWGAIIGGGIVFLLGTKKGKKLLKTISEEGVEGLSSLLEEQADQKEDYEEEEEESPSENGVSNDAVSENIEEQKEPQAIRKRFFRRK